MAPVGQASAQREHPRTARVEAPHPAAFGAHRGKDTLRRILRTRYSAYGRTAIRPPHAAIRDCGTRRNATDTLSETPWYVPPVRRGYKNVVCRKHAPSSDRRYFPTVNHRPDSSGVTSSINFPSAVSDGTVFFPSRTVAFFAVTGTGSAIRPCPETQIR